MVNSRSKLPAELEPARDPAVDVGHYFDQVIFDRHITLKEMERFTQVLLGELRDEGVTIDQATGEVTITAPATTKPDTGE